MKKALIFIFALVTLTCLSFINLAYSQSYVPSTASACVSTRTQPAFYTSSISVPAMQMQFNAGFFVPVSQYYPYSGILERVRTQCNGTTPTVQSSNTTDRFHEILQNRIAARRLITILPTSTANLQGYLLGTSSGVTPLGSVNPNTGGNNQPRGNGRSSCTRGGAGGNNHTATTSAVESNLSFVNFSTTTITPAYLGITSGSTAARNTERDRIVNWIHGAANSRGYYGRLGSIYHSSPVIVGAPLANIADESYNLFRQLPVVANRPTVLYVASNDGIIHAFATEDTTISAGPYAGRRVTAGEELWGFVPPYVFSRLNQVTYGHIFTVDGTPYVREVFYRRLPGQNPDGTMYHTVMIVPLGKGGGAYIAIDITDPFSPKFMWQYASPNLGQTLGTPGLAQILISNNGSLEERAIAILPAGYVPPIDPTTCNPITNDGTEWSRPLGCPSNGIGTPPLNSGTQNAVDNHKCWDTDGRQVSFIDPATGQVLRQFDQTVFGAPMTGGVGVYSGNTGTIATRAFMNDADGYMWRFDFSSTNPQNWNAMPFADMFVDIRATYPNVGQPSYNPPAISTDPAGQVVVVQSTGNNFNLLSTAPNRVLSLTETLNGNTVGIRTNWTIRLDFGEQAVGPVQLHNSNIYFNSYKNLDLISTTEPNCLNNGSSFLWGVDFIESSNGSPVGRLLRNGSNYVQKIGMGSSLVLGAAITQRMTCTTSSSSLQTIYDPYINGMIVRSGIDNVGQPGNWQLITSFANSNFVSNVPTLSVELEAPMGYVILNGFVGRVDQ